MSRLQAWAVALAGGYVLLFMLTPFSPFWVPAIAGFSWAFFIFGLQDWADQWERNARLDE